MFKLLEAALPIKNDTGHSIHIWLDMNRMSRKHGPCGCSAEAICPPGEGTCQDWLYRLVYGLTERMLQSAPSMVLVEDLSRSDDWARQKVRFKQLALDSGGAVLEEMGERKDCCAFVFSEMPGSFLRDVYWWMAEHGCGEELYAQYSVLEHMDAETTVSALKEKTCLDILMDDTHPVLLLQLGPASSIQQVTEALASACGGEGWTLCVK